MTPARAYLIQSPVTPVHVCCGRDGVFFVLFFYLRGVGDPQRDHIFASVLDEQVMLVQELHLPHAQLPELIEELKEPPFGRSAAILLCPSPQVHQQTVLQGVDGFLFIQPGETGLAFSLGLGVNRRQRQQVILVTKTSDGAHVKEGSFWCHLGRRKEQK